MNDLHRLHRFVDAQEGVYASVVEELSGGRKLGHWMWYIFPQLSGLGSSPTSQAYAIRSLAEARAYLMHPLLGPRLRECTQRLLAVKGRTAKEIFGHIDCIKFRSSMTLFDQVCEDRLFQDALRLYFDGEPDQRTLDLLDSCGEQR